MIGELRKSRDIYEALMARGSKYPELFERLGIIYEKMDLKEKAEELEKIARDSGDAKKSSVVTR